MTSSRAPLAVARTAVLVATRLLPTSDDRARYRAEFLAELYDLTPGRQLRHSAGVLVRMPALRAVLRSSSAHSQEAAMSSTTSRSPSWRCRVFHWHHWTVRSTEDGGRYGQCTRCGLDRGPVGYGPLTTPPWPGDTARRW